MSSSPATMRVSDTPPVIVAYGMTKVGKTVDTLYSFPEAHFIGDVRGFRGSAKIVGWVPHNIHEAPTIGEALKVIDKIGKTKPSSRPAMVVMDDFSLMVNEFKAAQHAKGRRGWDLNNDVISMVQRIIWAAKGLNIGIVFGCHEKGPALDKGKLGHPDVAFYTLANTLAAVCDAVFHATNFISATHKGWPFGYYGGGLHKAQWICGDRFNVALDQIPLNLREWAIAAGFDTQTQIPRPPGYEGVDELVNTMVSILSSGQGTVPQAKDHLIRLYRDGHALLTNESVTQWVIRDVIDRYTIRSMQSDKVFSIFD